MLTYITPALQAHGADVATPIVTPMLIMAAIILIAVMILHELSVQLTENWQTFARFLQIVIYPLLVVFGVALVMVFVDFAQHPPPLR